MPFIEPENSTPGAVSCKEIVSNNVSMFNFTFEFSLPELQHIHGKGLEGFDKGH